MAAAGLVLLAMAMTVPARSQSRDDCSGGSVYDDGTFENGYGAKPSSGWSEYVMRFNPPPGTRKLERVCACFTRSGADSSLSFDLNVYAVGLDGKPGALLGSQRAFAIGVPQHPMRRFYSYDVSGLDIEGDDPVFIGPAWSPVDDTQIYLCADQNGPVVQARATPTSPVAATRWSQPITDVFPTYKALGLRAQFDAPCEPQGRNPLSQRQPLQGRDRLDPPNGTDGRRARRCRCPGARTRVCSGSSSRRTSSSWSRSSIAARRRSTASGCSSRPPPTSASS